VQQILVLVVVEMVVLDKVVQEDLEHQLVLTGNSKYW
jgi:hypothetical protein